MPCRSYRFRIHRLYVGRIDRSFVAWGNRFLELDVEHRTALRIVFGGRIRDNLNRLYVFSARIFKILFQLVSRHVYFFVVDGYQYALAAANGNAPASRSSHAWRFGNNLPCIIRRQRRVFDRKLHTVNQPFYYWTLGNDLYAFQHFSRTGQHDIA
ncbi:hypothetical protein D3C86_1297000 [compost metagenome]